jgi:hypothetical protein
LQLLKRLFVTQVLALCLILQSMQPVFAHGGVVAEEDLCVIEIGIFRAHFTVYQPETRASKEFCEELPDVGNAVFVLDYLHDSLREVPLDFRIIRDVNNRTIYASWEDVQSIDDLEAATVFYQSPKISPGASMSVSHKFVESGWYTGVVTTRHPTRDLAYQAVFGFHVGKKDLGFWPLMALIIVALQAQYWISSGGYRRWQEKRKSS